MEHEYHGGKSLGRFLLRKVDHYQIYPLFLHGIFTEQRQWAAQVVAGAIVYIVRLRNRVPTLEYSEFALKVGADDPAHQWTQGR